ncbi:YwqG family protein [Lacunimicrobium album]
MNINHEIQASIDLIKTQLAEEPLLSHLEIDEIARPSIRFEMEKAEQDSIALGASRFGGNPDVPEGFEWPSWVVPPLDPRKKSPPKVVSLSFLAQIDLASLQFIDPALPRSGWLYFFYDVVEQPWGFDLKEKGSSRVIYCDVDRGSLKRMQSPVVDTGVTKINSYRLKPTLELSLRDTLAQFEYCTPEYDAYLKLLEKTKKNSQLSANRLLGFPTVIQNPMEVECQLVTNGIYTDYFSSERDERRESLVKTAHEWRLLLQIDSDEDMNGWMWGDCGMIYFWIRQQDLESRNFDQTWLILQCC